MRRVHFLVSLPLSLALVAMSSCDRRSTGVPTSMPARPVVLEVELKPLSPLLPNQATHAGADALGNIYWVQETERGDDTLFVIGEGGIPRATQLSAGNIGAALGASADAKGNIQAIGMSPAGDIFFYFLGTQGRNSLACFGLFTPRTSAIRILADSDGAPATATGMGASLPLARASIVSDAKDTWLWLRHSDASAMFHFDPRGISREGQIKLTRAFDSAKLNGQPLSLTREDYEISLAPEGTLFLLDLFAGRILQIKADGTAKVVTSVVNLPDALSTPTADRAGHLLLFAGAVDEKGQHTDLIAPKTVEDAGQLPLDTSYPAMLMFDLSSGNPADRRVSAIERDNLQAYPGFPVYRMRLQYLLPYPKEEAWISFDSGSGELLRLKIREKSY